MSTKQQLIDDSVWVSRMGKYFDVIDKERNGVITIDKVQQWATNMEKLCQPSAGEMVNLRAQLYNFWGEIGLKKGTLMSKKEFIEGVNRISCAEIERSKAGYVTLLDNLNNAFFDVIDQDKNNVLTMEELQYIMAAATKKTKDADKWMKQADSDSNGDIEREEFFNSERKFWYKIV